MNMTKRITAALAAMTLCVSLAACGGGNGGNTDDAAQSKNSAEQVAAAVEKLGTAKSLSISMQQDIGMTMKSGDQSQDMTYAISTDMDMFQNPIKAKGKMTIDMGDLGGKQEMELCMQEADDELSAYLGVEGQWIKLGADAEGMEMYNVQDSMDLYLDNASDFKEAGKEQVNGADATKFTGVIKGDKLEEVLKGSGVMGVVDQFAEQDMFAEDVETMLSNLGDLPMTVWVSAEGYPVQYEMDMNAMLTGIMDNVVKAAADAGADLSVQVSSAKIRMTCSNFDSVADFELPAETANAIDVAA